MSTELSITLDATGRLKFNKKTDHWVTTETGSHLMIRGGNVVAGAGGKFNGKPSTSKKMLAEKENIDSEFNDKAPSPKTDMAAMKAISALRPKIVVKHKDDAEYNKKLIDEFFINDKDLGGKSTYKVAMEINKKYGDIPHFKISEIIKSDYAGDSFKKEIGKNKKLDRLDDMVTFCHLYNAMKPKASLDGINYATDTLQYTPMTLQSFVRSLRFQ